MSNRDVSEFHRLDQLLAAMASPDPAVRDGWAYRELADGIRAGRFDGDRDSVRAHAVRHLAHPQVQARTFAPRILSWLVEAGDRDRAGWEAVTRWYVTEPDTRGYDEALGWLHGVAHGADYLAAAVRHGIATPAETLDVLVTRMLADGDAWVDQEDASVARALVAAMSMQPSSGRGGGAGGGDAPGASTWVRMIDGALDDFEAEAARENASARPPLWLRNVSATLAMLHVAVTERPLVDGEPVAIAGAEEVCSAVARVLSRLAPWLLQVRLRAQRGAGAG